MTSTTFDAIAQLDLEPIKVKLMHRESGEGWTLEHANAIEFEYRRFLILMKKFPNEQTAPLVDVDTFWHYHILDTMKYAVDCDAVFGHFLHHFPYIGLRGEDDEQAHLRVGQRMKELYEQTFGEDYVRADATYSGVANQAAYSGAAAAETAYSGAAAAQTAYSGAAAKTAYSGAAAAQTAYSGAAAKTAYSGAAAVQTAYSGAAAKTAYSGAAAVQTAYSGAAAKTAYSGAAAAQTAYSGAAAKTAYSGAASAQTAYSGAAGQTAYSGASAAQASAAIENARLASFYTERPRLNPAN
ncbi:hypothetical protein ACFOLJ_02500 [Rugamonas sp. CCM 8940]|uniref:hypothetical protein n=1 Tax=Rugamonas sp. CCM 8940 TaxID=2765359 RepID=UPI0018F357D8|nr:hypothetical protein [Rugamonas sp. CCM 8940]MBJ7311813.1 hypothetical protein [Rugamonas sp. CCM 8940]